MHHWHIRQLQSIEENKIIEEINLIVYLWEHHQFKLKRSFISKASNVRSIITQTQPSSHKIVNWDGVEDDSQDSYVHSDIECMIMHL